MSFKSKVLSVVTAAMIAVSPSAAAAQTSTGEATSSMSSFGSISIPGVNTGETPVAQNLVVNQGDMIAVRMDAFNVKRCTVGFVKGNKIYTAGHCSNGAVGNEVYLGSDQFAPRVGSVTEAYVGNRAQIESTDHQDWMVITVDPGVTIGANSLSGNRVVPWNEINIGDNLCQYGSFTATVQCAPITFKTRTVNGTLGNMVYSVRGDSGGPAWIPGKGYVAHIRGSFDRGATIPSSNTLVTDYIRHPYLVG